MDSVWINGEIVRRSDAKISVFDHGLVTGDGVFETIGVYEGVAFTLERHLARLQRSAHGIGLGELPMLRIRAGIDALLTTNQCAQGKIRITVTAGDSVLGSDRIDSPLSIVIATGARVPAPITAKVQVAPWPKNERGILSGLKTISYCENVAALAWARKFGADEVVFGNTIGNLCEGSGSNIFIVLDGKLYTPPLSSGALGGITRELIVNHFGVIERDFPLSVLYSTELEECFLASSIREAQAISHIDDVPTAHAPGPVTKEIAAEFLNLVMREIAANNSDSLERQVVGHESELARE